MEPLRRRDDLIPGSLSARDASEFVPEFDEHLAALSNLFHQYQKHAWVSEQVVPEYSDLARAHCADVLEQLDTVGRTTVAFGGVPLGSPLEHVNRSYLDHENEGVYSAEAMVERSLRYEEVLVLRLTITLEAAQDVNAEPVEAALQPLIESAKRRRDRLHRFLKEQRE